MYQDPGVGQGSVFLIPYFTTQIILSSERKGDKQNEAYDGKGFQREINSIWFKLSEPDQN